MTEKTGLSTLRRLSTDCGRETRVRRRGMSGLSRSIAAVAERLGDTPRTAGVRGSAADRAIAAPAHLAEILSMPLDRFVREGQLLEVRVPWLDVTVWVV